MQELVAEDILSGHDDDVLYIGNRHEFAMHVNKPTRVTCPDLLTPIEMSKMGCWDSEMTRQRYCDKCFDYNRQYTTFFKCGHNNCAPCLRHTGRVLEKQGFSSFKCGHPKCTVSHLLAENQEGMEIPKSNPWDCPSDDPSDYDVDPFDPCGLKGVEEDEEDFHLSEDEEVALEVAREQASLSAQRASSSSIPPASMSVQQASSSSIPPASVSVPQASSSSLENYPTEAIKGSKAKKRDAQAKDNEVQLTHYFDGSF